MIWDAQHIHYQLMLSSDQVVSVSSHHTQQVPPSCACIDVLHHQALYLLSHWSQGLCVESDEAVVGELESASYFNIN